MLTKKNKFQLALVTLLLSTTSIYAEYPYDGFNEQSSTQKEAPSEDVSDLTTTIIKNITANKSKKTLKKSQVAKADFSSLIIMDSEKASVKSGTTDITSSAFRLSYDKELNAESDVGAIFSYRQSKVDATGVKSKSYLLAPYYKYYSNITDKIDVQTIGNLVLGKQKNSGATSDYSKYGGGVTFVPNYYVSDALLFNAPVGLQSMKNSSGAGAGNTERKDIFNYGLGMEYNIQPNWLLNTSLLQTKDLGSSAKATYYTIQSTYYGELWNMGLGYKTVKNVTNYDEDSYMVSVQYNW